MSLFNTIFLVHIVIINFNTCETIFALLGCANLPHRVSRSVNRQVQVFLFAPSEGVDRSFWLFIQQGCNTSLINPHQ